MRQILKITKISQGVEGGFIIKSSERQSNLICPKEVMGALQLERGDVVKIEVTGNRVISIKKFVRRADIIRI